LQSCQNCNYSELTVPHPAAALMSLMDHGCYYVFKDLLLVYSTCLVASYGMTHRDSKVYSLRPTVNEGNDGFGSIKVKFTLKSIVLHTKLKRIKFPREDMASVFCAAQALFNYGA
jgi:hypothetical protein